MADESVFSPLFFMVHYRRCMPFIDCNERAPVRHRCRGKHDYICHWEAWKSCAGAVVRTLNNSGFSSGLGFTTQALGRWSSAAVQCCIRWNAVMFWKAEEDGAYPPYC